MSEQELITIKDNANALEVFSGEEGLNAYVEEARAIVLGFEHKLDTDSGRSKTKSLAAKVSKLKTKLDGLGKDLVSDWKTKAKAVDNNRKAMRDQLDELKVIARQPLTDWEDQQKLEAEEKLKREQAEKLASEKESDHEFALLLDEKVNRDIAEEKERLIKEEADRVARVAAEAEENQKRLEKEAKEKADAEAKAAIDKAAKDKAEAEQRAKDAEERRISAEKQAKADKVTAEKEAKAAAERAEQEQKQAVIDAEARVKREAEEAEKVERAATEKREANKKHRAAINNKAVDCLVAGGISKDVAKAVITIIAKKEVDNVSISY